MRTAQGLCLIQLSFLIGYKPPTQQHTAFFMLGDPLADSFFSVMRNAVCCCMGGWCPIKNDN